MVESRTPNRLVCVGEQVSSAKTRMPTVSYVFGAFLLCVSVRRIGDASSIRSYARIHKLVCGSAELLATNFMNHPG